VPDIVLTTLNAKYIHAAFGLRYLMANLGELAGRARMMEFDISQRPIDVLEQILAEQPRIVGIGVYIWNVSESTRLVADLKRLRPDITVVLGGPEVSYETEQQEIARLADYVITGEADLAFAELCRKLLPGERPLMKVIAADLPEFGGAASSVQVSVPRTLNPEPQTLNPPQVQLPYDLYTDRDIAHRMIYVEASRGCPFKCEFCLSSLDVPVRNVPLEPFLAHMQRLLGRGVRHFKFVDRTFNLNLNISRAILRFFLDRYQPGLFLHFEMIPDRLPAPLRELIAEFPPGALQFEVGIQSFNEQVCERISRRQDNDKLADNFRFLREQTGVHIHADLIVGLPGEDLESFAAGFDRLVALGPQEIQVGILKRLRGTPIARHTTEWGMVYSPHPPYEVLETSQIDFAMMQRLRRFARYWDMVSNSGNFVRSTPMIWRDGSPFRSFLHFTDWLYGRAGRAHGIALPRLTEMLFRYLVDETRQQPGDVAAAVLDDYHRTGRSDIPPFLRAFVTDFVPGPRAQSLAPGRQARHVR
jgi:radical SAM superfamily enzyme YgiQ (UPF0313 family)